MEVKKSWVAADHLISPLGFTAEENYRAIREGRSGLRRISDPLLSIIPVCVGKIPDFPRPGKDGSQPPLLTRFEQLVILSIQGVLRKVRLDSTSPRTIFILSTTKGNIDLLEQGKGDSRQIALAKTAGTICRFFGNPNLPLVVSNACISGVMAMLIGKRLLESGQYDHVVVSGADVISRFVVSGFQSLQAISQEPCRPFDKNRNGISLGEAAATVVLTNDPGAIGADPKIGILGGGISNDANHISGPSRTGEELGMAIQQAMTESRVGSDDIDFISAHGTATLYNDEMEAKAFNGAGLKDTPLNSLKGSFGHTLGAAGVVESVMSIHALLNNELLPTTGFESLGVSLPINISNRLKFKSLTTCLKTASGFGGCNAAMIMQKVR